VFPNSLSWVRRSGRASAPGLLVLGVLAGALTVTTPATASTLAPSPVDTPLITAAEVSTVAAASPTRTKIRANRTRVTKGSAVRLTGKVTHGKSSVRRDIVRLQVRRGGAWTYMKGKHLSSKGVVTFTVYPPRSLSYRLYYPGNRILAKSSSKPTTIRVVAKAKVSTASVSGKRARVLAIARSLSGRPYSFGAAGPRAFDCSGFTQYVFRKVGVKLPHQANAQKSRGVRVSRASARAGDLVLFLSGGHAYHVGIYAGGNYMYDSPRPGLRTGKHKIWSSNIIFRRVL
jgi:cell wall-associated NlpC family hydrolase